MSEHDEARDPHLREALRHAPDAQLEAPAALGDFILKEARAKARDPSPAAVAEAPGWARRLWDWLARPAVATGFAGVMAATLVGLMWWDRPMDEAMPRSPVPAAARVPERPAGTPTPIAPTAPTATPAPAPAPAPIVAQESLPKPAARQPAPARKAAPAATEARNARNASPAGTTGAVADTAPPAPPPAAPAPMPAPAPAAAPPVTAADASADAQVAKARSEEQKRERSSTAPAEAASRRAAKALLDESRLQFEAEAFTRVASVRAAIAGEPNRWAWQRANAASQPMSDAVYAWLAQLDGSTATGWQPRVARETSTPRGRALTLLRDGQVQHSFQLTERGVLWKRGQTTWLVELPAETVAALQSALEIATP